MSHRCGFCGGWFAPYLGHTCTKHGGELEDELQRLREQNAALIQSRRDLEDLAIKYFDQRDELATVLREYASNGFWVGEKDRAKPARDVLRKLELEDA